MGRFRIDLGEIGAGLGSIADAIQEYRDRPYKEAMKQAQLNLLRQQILNAALNRSMALEKMGWERDKRATEALVEEMAERNKEQLAESLAEDLGVPKEGLKLGFKNLSPQSASEVWIRALTEKPQTHLADNILVQIDSRKRGQPPVVTTIPVPGLPSYAQKQAEVSGILLDRHLSQEWKKPVPVVDESGNVTYASPEEIRASGGKFSRPGGKPQQDRIANLLGDPVHMGLALQDPDKYAEIMDFTPAEKDRLMKAVELLRSKKKPQPSQTAGGSEGKKGSLSEEQVNRFLYGE